MKKFTLLAALAALAFGMQAQTVKFLAKGVEVANGTTHYSADWGEPDYGEIFGDPEISILSDASMTVDVTADCTSGQMIQMCCGGLCVRNQKVEKTGIELKANTPLPTEFEAFYYDDEPTPTVITDLYVYASGTKNELAHITVVMNESGLGAVSVFEVDNTLVRFENGELIYSAEAPCDLVLYSANGQRVLEEKVNGNGSIKTAGMTSGVYVYTIGNKSGKVVIR